MKALYIYNPFSAKEQGLINRAKAELGALIDVKSINEIPDMLKSFVRATPALIVINDDLQGQHLLNEDEDAEGKPNGQLIATAMLLKRLEEEDLAIHQQETHRLDNLIKLENQAAIDEYTLELIDTGVL